MGYGTEWVRCTYKYGLGLWYRIWTEIALVKYSIKSRLCYQPVESPNYILHEEWLQSTRGRPAIQLVKLGINYIVSQIHEQHTNWDFKRARPTHYAASKAFHSDCINHSIGRTHSSRACNKINKNQDGKGDCKHTGLFFSEPFCDLFTVYRPKKHEEGNGIHRLRQRAAVRAGWCRIGQIFVQCCNSGTKCFTPKPSMRPRSPTVVRFFQWPMLPSSLFSLYTVINW